MRIFLLFSSNYLIFDTYHTMHCREEQGARLKLMRKRVKDLRVWLMPKTW